MKPAVRGAMAMEFSPRNAISRLAERILRFLTASALRSTAIFVFLTFVPILLLTYYIVSTSIKTTRADAVRADVQMRDAALAILRTNFSSEREALAGVSDATSFQRALASADSNRPAAIADREAAAATLARLHRRRPEFAWFALYTAAGEQLAVAPPNAPAPLSLGNPPALPAWFEASLTGSGAISTLQPASDGTPRALDFSVPITGAATTVPGVLVGVLPTSVVADWIQHFNVGADRYLYFFDNAKHLIAASAGSPFNQDQIAALPELNDALQGRAGSGNFIIPIQLTSHAVAYGDVPGAGALLLVRPVHFGFYLFRVFYDKLALIAVIVFLLAVASGLLLRSAFRYYQRYNREVESGRSKIEALLGSIGDGVFAVDGDGLVIEFNPAASALTRLPAASVLRHPYADNIHLFDERTGAAFDPVGQAMHRGQSLRIARDLALARADGSRLPLTLSAAPVRDENGNVQGCVVVFNDASQEREVDRLKNEFISLASHQLRTPMSGVKGALALLTEEVLGPLNPEQRHYLRRAYESNERLIALVNDLLNVSRLEQGRLQLRVERVNLAAIVRTLVEELQPRALHYRQHLRWESPAGDTPDAFIQGDASQLREVFANLLDNAIKYTPEGGTIVARLLPAPDRVVVEISDSGVGIPADKLPNLFQKFTRIQNPLSGREFGTGLGLYFARSIVELHRGSIEVTSRPGAGTTFRVVLPRLGAVAPAPASDLGALSPITAA